MKKLLLLTLAGMLCMGSYATTFTRAQIVSYASSLKGLKKSELKTAIYKLCQPTKVLSYGSGSSATWSGFVKTDRIGTTLECRNRYSTTRYYFTSTSSTSAISGMNIEHSFPKSWWGGSSTVNAYKDLFNLYPSESTANSYKSNYPMGKVTTATHSDYEIVGTGSAGSNGTIQLCEPNDTWKGDFCRSYFYMATIYQNLTWQGTQGLQELENDTWPTLQEWAYTLYLEWTRTDKVSDIEVDRNNAVYDIQGNRNLFIDFPELAEYVWGDSIDVAFNPNTSLTSASDDGRFATYQAGNYGGGSSSGGTTTTTATAPTLTSSASFTADSYSVTITNNESGATVYYTTDGTTPTTSSSSFTGTSKTLSITATTTVKAMAVVSGKSNSSVTSATYTKSIANTAETAYTIAEARSLIDAGNDLTTQVYVKGIISSIGSLNSNYGELTYYISDDGSTTSDQFEIYDGFNLNQAKFTSTSDIEVGATVIVYGTLKKYNSTYEFNYGNYIVKYTAPSSAQTTPTFALGTYKTSMTVGDAADSYSVTTNSDGTLSAKSSSTSVATVSISGTTVTVTPVAAGTTTITVSAAETTAYEAASKSYTLTVSAAAVTVSSIALSGTYSTSFTKGNAFSHDGMTVTATYSDGTTKDVTSSATFSGYDMSTAGTQTVTVSYTEDSKTVTATYNITVSESSEDTDNTGVLFYESFDTNSGTGGNDSSWNGSGVAVNDIASDNTGWTFTNGFGANKCAKFGSGSKAGSAQTPSITFTGTATITFKAAAWDGNSESTTLNISATNGTLSQTSVTLVKGEWTEYTITITGVTSSTQLTFASSSSSNNRFFLDEVKVVTPSSTNLLGDVDVDGDVDLDDLTLLSNYILAPASTTVSDQGLINADINTDSTINIADLANLIKLLNE